MTNEEKAREIASKYERWDQEDDESYGAYKGAMQMAKWEKQQMLEKACEWLEKNCTYIHPRTGKETCVVNLNAFKKAMEE